MTSSDAEQEWCFGFEQRYIARLQRPGQVLGHDTMLVLLLAMCIFQTLKADPHH